jgi:hypothetical protein
MFKPDVPREVAEILKFPFSAGAGMGGFTVE